MGGIKIVGMTLCARKGNRRELNKMKDLYEVSLEGLYLFTVQLSSVRIGVISSRALDFNSVGQGLEWRPSVAIRTVRVLYV